MQKLSTLVVHGMRVLTTRQLANMYGTEPEIINNNFTRNKEKYKLEKHYIAVEGDEMRQLKTSHQFDGELKRVSRAYFWTEKGALLHAKSLNTDKAWEVYDYLVDFYFRMKEENPAEQKKEVVPASMKESPAEGGKKITLPYMRNPMMILKYLLILADEQGIALEVKDLPAYRSHLSGKKIAVHKHLPFSAIVFEVAYEMAHWFIHYESGDIIKSPLKKDYNTQAEAAAFMIVRLLDIKVNKG